MTQTYTSAKTSRKQVPAMFKKIDWQPGTRNLDLGGGKYDDATRYLETKHVFSLVHDKYNRPTDHNRDVDAYLRLHKADTCTIANVLNVIQEPECRLNVLRKAKMALKDGGVCYISVYDGDKSGVGKATRDGFQANRITKDYIREIEQVFANVSLKNGVITAHG